MLVDVVAAGGSVAVAELPEVDHRRGRPAHDPLHRGTTGRPRARRCRTATSCTWVRRWRSGVPVTMLISGHRARARGNGPPPASMCGDAVLPHLGHRAAVHERCRASGRSIVFPPPGRWDPGTHLAAHRGAPRRRRGRGCPRSTGGCSSTPTSTARPLVADRRCRRAARRSRPSSCGCSARRSPTPTCRTGTA